MKPMNWLREFNDFMESPTAPPSQSFVDRLRTTIHRDLNPSFGRVLVKVVPIHLLSAGITLLVCPQFGIGFSLFGDHGLLMPILMSYGGVVCAIGCGAFFLCLSGLLAALWLRPEELKRARRSELSYLTLIVGLSWGGFMLNGAAMDVVESLSWTAGALVGGFISFHAGLVMRRWFDHSSRAIPHHS